MPDGLERMKYHLVWNPTGDWVAVPEDQSKQLEMTVHSCEEREEYLNRPVEAVTISPVLLDELADQGIIEERIVERVVTKELTHEQSIARAKRLAVRCPVCMVQPYIWCRYIAGEKEGEDTVRLHTPRQPK
jgi:hypothetical protein